MKKKKVQKTIHSILQELNSIKPTREELLVILGQVLVNSGYSVYYSIESQKEAPEKVTAEQAQGLYFNEPTLGTTLMKLGFDLQGVLLKELRETMEGEK